MPELNLPSPERDPIYLVRSIGRLAQILLEIRDEYILAPNTDTLDQFERRIEEIDRLHSQLRTLREQLGTESDTGTTVN